MAKKNWIKGAIKKPGSLRRSLGIKKGQKIPARKLAAAAKKPGKLGKRARLAQTLRKMKKGEFNGYEKKEGDKECDEAQKNEGRWRCSFCGQ